MKDKSTQLPVPARLVGVVTSREELRAFPDEAEHLDLLEIRLDCLEDLEALPETSVPILLTARSRDEGGVGGSTADRLALVRRHWEGAAYIDLEIATLSASTDARELATEARTRGITVIGSFHDFEGTPPTRRLAELAEDATWLPVDILKIATATAGPGDVSVLATFQAEAKSPTATMGMGPLGVASRPLLAQLGSELVYGSILQPKLRGQWRARDLRIALDALKQVPQA